MKHEIVILPAGLWAEIQRFMTQTPASSYGTAPAGVIAEMLGIVKNANARPAPDPVPEAMAE